MATKHYTHVGTQPLVLYQTDGTLTVDPGTEFDAELTPGHESYLKTIGAIAEGSKSDATGETVVVPIVAPGAPADPAVVADAEPQAASLRGKAGRRPVQPAPDAAIETK